MSESRRRRDPGCGIVGPIATSEPLRELWVLRGMLERTCPERADELTPAPRSLPLSEIEEVERALGVALPLDVLALAALRIPIFIRATGIAFDDFTAPHALAPDDDWVAIATAEHGDVHPEYEFSATDQGVWALTLCVRRDASRDGDPEVLVIDEHDPDAAEPRTLSAYLRARLAMRYEEHWDDATRNAASSAAVAPIPDLHVVDDRPAPLQIRVTHPKFGPGTIVSAAADGKCEVRFDTGDTKIMLRRVLTETAEPSEG